MTYADRIWGWGLYPKRWLWGHLELRRNTLVYDIEIHFKRARLTFTIWREKKRPTTPALPTSEAGAHDEGAKHSTSQTGPDSQSGNPTQPPHGGFFISGIPYYVSHRLPQDMS